MIAGDAEQQQDVHGTPPFRVITGRRSWRPYDENVLGGRIPSPNPERTRNLALQAGGAAGGEPRHLIHRGPEPTDLPDSWRTLMRKKLVSLGFALAALVAASTFTPAAADPSTCPPNSHRIVCPDGHSFCCPNNALCICAPF